MTPFPFPLFFIPPKYSSALMARDAVSSNRMMLLELLMRRAGIPCIAGGPDKGS